MSVMGIQAAQGPWWRELCILFTRLFGAECEINVQKGVHQAARSLGW